MLPTCTCTCTYTRLRNNPRFLHSSLAASPHFLFDCDGLILDTEPVYSRVALLALQTFLAGTLTFPRDLKLKVMGASKDQVSALMAQYLNSVLSADSKPVSPAEWAARTAPLEAHHFALGCPLMPGIVDLVPLVKAKGLLAAVATSSDRRTFYLKSGPHSELVAHLDSITCGDDPDYSLSDHDCSHQRPSVQGKPHPSIFHTARHHLNRSPRQPGIVLEDSPNGVVAALRSGHSCIWVPCVEVDGPGFELIDDILASGYEIPEGLWVYRADSLYEVIEALSV